MNALENLAYQVVIYRKVIRFLRARSENGTKTVSRSAIKTALKRAEDAELITVKQMEEKL